MHWLRRAICFLGSHKAPAGWEDRLPNHYACLRCGREFNVRAQEQEAGDLQAW